MVYPYLQVLLIIHVLAINGLEDGMRANVGEFKFIVSIWQENKPLCAGAIIYKRHVLTAAHCVYQEPAFSLFVYAGLISFEDPNLLARNVRHIHQYYGTEILRRTGPEPFYFKNDIAILEVDNEFPWSSTITPIPIPEVEYWNPCEPCLVPGWNIAKKHGITTMTLVSLYAHVFNDNACRRSVNTLFPGEKCAYDESGRAIAKHGDSGSPFVCKGVLSGIIVRGYAQLHMPTIVLSVYPFRDFIYQTIHDDTEDVHPEEFPYVVSIWSNDSFICGGTIVDDLHVVTIAHRVKDLEKATLKVSTGKRVISEQYPITSWSTVDFIDLYLHYEQQFLNYAPNPIAVFKLTTRLVWNPIVMGASPLTGTDPQPGTHCKVLRWARRTEWWGSITRRLVWVPALILTNQRCEELGILLGSNEFCASSIHPFPLAFKEDSGNPMVCDGTVVGIVANGLRKLSLFASSQAIFIRLSPYMGAIKYATKRN